jgi:hypothetical protein
MRRTWTTTTMQVGRGAPGLWACMSRLAPPRQSRRALHSETRTSPACSPQELVAVPLLRPASLAKQRLSRGSRSVVRPRLCSVGVAACSPPTCTLRSSGAATPCAPDGRHRGDDASCLGSAMVLYSCSGRVSPRVFFVSTADCTRRPQQEPQDLDLAPELSNTPCRPDEQTPRSLAQQLQR